jgi:hypothetical protein
MPDATLSVLRNVRHLTPMECPAVIADEILVLMRRARRLIQPPAVHKASLHKTRIDR